MDGIAARVLARVPESAVAETHVVATQLGHARSVSMIKAVNVRNHSASHYLGNEKSCPESCLLE